MDGRTLTATTIGTDTCDGPALRQFLKLQRTITNKDETQTTVADAITSRSVESSTADQLLGLCRDRWGIEHRLFRVKDITFRKDHSHIQTDLAAFAISLIRNASIIDIRSSGHSSIATTLRSNALQITSVLARLSVII